MLSGESASSWPEAMRCMRGCQDADAEVANVLLPTRGEAGALKVAGAAALPPLLRSLESSEALRGLAACCCCCAAASWCCDAESSRSCCLCCCCCRWWCRCCCRPLLPCAVAFPAGGCWCTTCSGRQKLAMSLPALLPLPRLLLVLVLVTEPALDDEAEGAAGREALPPVAVRLPPAVGMPGRAADAAETAAAEPLTPAPAVCLGACCIWCGTWDCCCADLRRKELSSLMCNVEKMCAALLCRSRLQLTNHSASSVSSTTSSGLVACSVVGRHVAG